MTAATIRLADYSPPTFLVETVSLTFRLSPTATRVSARLRLRRNRAADGDLRLDGEKLRLVSIRLDGHPIAASGYSLDDSGLTIPSTTLPDAFSLETEVEIDPLANTALSGLYMSKCMFCTQCEAEGFRRITFYPDRPDVMATFSVRIEGDLPILLSNGNPTASGPGWAEWHDPWPKPAYLFALVAGDLVSHDDSFTTASGRKVSLKIWVRPGDEDKCAYAMDALKRSMKWDEAVYGREYDLDLFQIVAVDDFNMGAMENKGLNIFNSKFVLASPETATDRDYEFIEGIIAHEYFHNWTGNRITCRDWFQLSLKEGLTVFRDQMFSGDQRSHAVKRIAEVQQLRARQFREDAGPLAHPVRPAEYKEINNFYTATIYEKGAEVISMLHGMVGPDAYRRALDLYFERHDGEACTIEDWLKVFTDTTGRDLTQFKLWYEQSGTPRLKVTEHWQPGATASRPPRRDPAASVVEVPGQARDNRATGSYTLTFRQSNPATPGQKVKHPQVIPIAVGLLNPNGDEVVPTTVLELTEAEQSFTFEGLATRPVPSLLRNFSAPVILDRTASAAERAFLLAHDTDPFNKWESAQSLARDGLVAMVLNGAGPAPDFLDAMHRMAMDATLDPAFRALALGLPSEDDIAQTIHEAGTAPDPLAIHDARRKLARALAVGMGRDLAALYHDMAVPGPYSPDAEAAGRRALRAAALALLSRRDGPAEAEAAFTNADNMTESLSALSCLLAIGAGEAEADSFHRRWRQTPLVLDKWFALRAALAPPDTAVATVRALADHKDFDWKNPNRFRSLVAAFAMSNPAGFHDPQGTGYGFVADWVIRLDKVNPQTTARLSTAFETWRRYDPERQSLMQAELQRIATTEGLSRDTAEMVGRMLGA